MKKIITIIAIFFAAFNVKAATLTLNNATPSAGQYSTWTAALAAANNGDTILIHGTTNNYYTLNVTKRLTIIGPGHHPTDKQNTQRAFCDAVTFHTGSNGSRVIGLETSNIQSLSGNVDSISILLCLVTDALYFQTPNCNFWLVDGCVFTNPTWDVRASNNAVGDLVCRNNIFNGRMLQMAGIFIGYNYFNNNIFLSADANTFNNVNNAYINNNIFYRSGLQTPSSTGLVFNSNSSFQCAGGNVFPNGVNYTNIDPQFVTSIGTGAYFNYATDYHLQATSPLINAGGDGTDLGVYGGYGDYEQNGVPHNPYVKTFNIIGSNSVNAGSPIQIYIKAKVRN
jgi:hypothetical protein